MFRKRIFPSLSISALVALSLGLAATAILFAGLRRMEHDLARLDFQQHAETRIAAINDGIACVADAVQSINQLFASVDSVSREQFQAFTQPLLVRYPFIQTLSFQRILAGAERAAYEARMRGDYPDFVVTEMVNGKRVAAGARDRYDVVEYIEPMRGNEAAFGLDVLPGLHDSKAIRLHGAAVLASSAGLIRAAHESAKQLGFMVMVPVYRSSLEPDGNAPRRPAAIGNAAAVFRIGELVNRVLATGGFLRASDIGVSLYAGQTPNDRDLLFRAGVAPPAMSDDTRLPRWLFWDRTERVSRMLDLGGTPHLLQVAAPPILFTENPGGSLFMLALGAILSLTCAAWLQLRASRRRRVGRRMDLPTVAQGPISAPANANKLARAGRNAELEFHVNHDILTGLASANLLEDRLVQALAYAERYGHQVWVICIDLDRFKFVNDALGHKTGDMVLRLMSERLQAAVREMDTVARFGGDEFLLVLPESGNENLASTAVQRILEAVAVPLRIDGHEFFLTCSIGVAIYPADGADADLLIKHADIAMYRAKELGRNNFQFYTSGMNAQALERLRMEGALRKALEQDEFVLHYQPQVDLRSGRVVGMEALIRWQQPELGMIPPARFIGLAEETGLIVPLGAWVMRTACLQNKAWQDAGLGPLRVAVNLSARQFYQQDLVASVAATLQESGLEPQYLEIELTESMVMTDVDRTIAILRDLKKLGVHLSIDDFGTGYSSLSYLKRFPIDVLKIDQSFVRDITVDPDDAAIVTSIISLAHSLRLSVIAEGVETAAQLAYLQRHRCDLMQGYYFSKPVPVDEFAQLLRLGTSLPPNLLLEKESRRTLLIVDDEANILNALKRLLHKDGYCILTARTPAEGFELLALHPVQVVISDQCMPPISGVEFLSKVKDLYPDTVRIVLSGYAELGTVIDAINHGAAYRFFTKPWDDDVLRNNIRGAFRHYWLQQGGQSAGMDDSATSASSRYHVLG